MIKDKLINRPVSNDTSSTPDDNQILHLSSRSSCLSVFAGMYIRAAGTISSRFSRSFFPRRVKAQVRLVTTSWYNDRRDRTHDRISRVSSARPLSPWIRGRPRCAFHGLLIHCYRFEEGPCASSSRTDCPSPKALYYGKRDIGARGCQSPVLLPLPSDSLLSSFVYSQLSSPRCLFLLAPVTASPMSSVTILRVSLLELQPPHRLLRRLNNLNEFEKFEQ